MRIEKPDNNFDVVNAVVGAALFLFVVTIYSLTKAASVSFWDCGEFIAASFGLGVPHPPGSPLYILIGRIFALLPLAEDLAARINYLSVISSSFAALFGYLVAVRMLRHWFGSDRSTFARLLVYGGAISGSCFLAFGLTNWGNSVEAEVYGLSMMLMMAIFWLTLIYWEKKGTPTANRIMLLIFYLGFAGVGVHMTVFLPVIMSSLFFIIKRQSGSGAWYAVAVFFALQLYLIFALSSRPDEIPIYLPVGIVLLLFMFFIFSFERIPKLYMLTAAMFLAAIVPAIGSGISALGLRLGYSPASGLSSIIAIAGTVGMICLIGFGIYTTYRFFRGGRSERQFLIVSLFVLAAALSVAVLFFTKGYFPFLILSAIVALIFIGRIWKEINWSILIATGGASLVVMGVYPHFAGMAVAALILLVGGLAGQLPGYRNALLILLVATLGYSVHAFIPIRSAQRPTINENDPAQSLTATINYVERKQYGSQSMTERIFKRRAEWSSQFGTHPRMSFWGFFSEQYGLNGSKFILLFLLGVFGIWEIVRRKPEHGLPFLILLVISSIGLVLYMNFADGTRQHPVTGADYLEVRDRDYFFTPAFMLFGLAIGFGASILIQFVREAVRGFSAIPRRVVLTSILVLLMLPGFAMATNYYLCDRSRNHIAFDYARNILISAEPNAVLFTNGDNDTFPLWCLQDVYGIRRDVRNINLSLANTKWYIKQLKNDMNVPLGWSDSDIDNLTPYRIRSGTVFRLQDQVIDAAIQNSGDSVPINFSVTVGVGARRFLGRQIDSMLILRGMIWSFDRNRSSTAIDRERCLSFYTDPEQFRTRGINDPSIYMNATTRRLTRNYANGMLMVAENFWRAGETETALALVESAVERIPHSKSAAEYLGTLYADQGREEQLSTMIAGMTLSQRPTFEIYLARARSKNGNLLEAESLLVRLLSDDTSYRPALDEMMRMYFKHNQVSKMQDILKRWVSDNPDDEQMQGLLVELEKQIEQSNRQPDGENSP